MEQDAKKAFLSKKLCKTLGIEWGKGLTIKGFEECNADWWMAYITRDKLIEDFLNENIGRRKTIEVKYLRRDDRSEKYARIKRTELNGLIDEKKHIIFSLEDITRKIIRNRQIEKKAFSDNLTGLSNRALFEIELEKISSERWRKNFSYALFINIITVSVSLFRYIKPLFMKITS